MRKMGEGEREIGREWNEKNGTVGTVKTWRRGMIMKVRRQRESD